MRNPCLSCGACCSLFRVSFPYHEADDYTSGGVPTELTEDVNQFYRAMKGTNQSHSRCEALRGEIGREVYCTIHERRSSTCREFTASFEDGKTAHSKCDRVRAFYGLPPLSMKDWEEEGDYEVGLTRGEWDEKGCEEEA